MNTYASAPRSNKTTEINFAVEETGPAMSGGLVPADAADAEIVFDP